MYIGNIENYFYQDIYFSDSVLGDVLSYITLNIPDL
jgi:hypothetical protein